MRTLLSFLVIPLVLSGCTLVRTRENAAAAQDPTADPDWAPELMSVDEFVKAIKDGKTVSELEPQLGDPVVSNYKLQYKLRDGEAGHEPGHIVVRRREPKEKIVLDYPPKPRQKVTIFIGGRVNKAGAYRFSHLPTLASVIDLAKLPDPEGTTLNPRYIAKVTRLQDDGSIEVIEEPGDRNHRDRWQKLRLEHGDNVKILRSHR